MGSKDVTRKIMMEQDPCLCKNSEPHKLVAVWGPKRNTKILPLRNLIRTVEVAHHMSICIVGQRHPSHFQTKYLKGLCQFKTKKSNKKTFQFQTWEGCNGNKSLVQLWWCEVGSEGICDLEAIGEGERNGRRSGDCFAATPWCSKAGLLF